MSKAGTRRAVEKLLRGLERNQLQSSEAVLTMYLLSKSYANQGHLDQALSWVEKTVTIDSVNPVYHHLHASILQELNRVEDASQALKRAVFLDANFVVAHFALGSLSRQQGSLAEVRAAFQECSQEFWKVTHGTSRCLGQRA